MSPVLEEMERLEREAWEAWRTYEALPTRDAAQALRLAREWFAAASVLAEERRARGAAQRLGGEWRP